MWWARICSASKEGRVKIKRIAIHNYRGIEERDIEVAPSGAVAKGRNGAGKTTILRAIKAALLAQDVKADAIRKGADRAEILVDLGDLQVKRIITSNATTVAVERGEFEVKKPQTYLTELLGTSSLDPMDLLTLRGKERLQKVLDALPVRVTVEQLRQWWPKCPDDYPCEGHGLQVIERVRKAAYDKRTAANKSVKETAAEASRLAAEAITAERAAPKEEPDVLALEAVVEAAKAGLAALQSRHEQAASQGRKTEAQRARVNALRSQAVALVAGAEDPSAVLEIEKEQRKVRMAAQEEVTRLQAALDAAIEVRNREQDALDDVCSRRVRAVKATTDAAQLQQQADEIDATLAQAAVEPVTEEDLEMARRSESISAQDLQAARDAAAKWRKACAAAQAASAAQSAADTAKAEASRLDGIVHALTEDAPAALLASCDGIDGITLEGDEVLYNGIRLDTLCGAEQVRVCVEIARRLNKKSKVLVVDGLERLDPEQLEVFVREATRGDYQLIATRVDRGDVVIESLTPEPPANDQAAE